MYSSAERNPKSTSREARKFFEVFGMPAIASELAVITHAKRLTDYVFVITKSSPKQYRMSIAYSKKTKTSRA